MEDSHVSLDEQNNSEKIAAVLRSTQRKYQTLVETLSDFVWETDQTGRCTFASPQVEKLWGFKPADMIGKTPFELMPQVDSERTIETFSEHAKSKQPIRGYVSAAYDAYGRLFYVETSAEPYFDDKGELLGYRGITRDITERKKTEEALRKSELKLKTYTNNLKKIVEERTRQLQEKERLAAIGATAGMVGHDIRNPLQAIVSEVYLLRDALSNLPEGPTKSEVDESLDGIDQNISYINKIVLDLQDYSKALYPEYTRLDISELMSSIINDMCIPNNIDVVISSNTFIKISTDPTYIKRVLTNLINNAIQAMPTGGVLDLATYRRGNSVIIIVADTGVGIPEEIKSKVFSPMTTTKSKGQGLGLAVAKRLVEALNGKISFESVEGKGTKFKIVLPNK
ncbi:MAG: PAS domain S-box protein [Candidatus Bathyarchaeota archaeon]|nr:PAS domain S-box protein [Candidatus Bathyarchaeota archaeon]